MENQGFDWKDNAKEIAIFAGALVVLVVATVWAMAEPPGELGIWPTLAVVAGPLAVWGGFKELRKRQLIRNTPTSKIRSLAVGDVEVKGMARPVDDPLLSPLTHTDACIYELEVEEEHETEDGSFWRTVLEMRHETPFVIDDGTGRVRVDASQADLSVEREQRVHVDGGDLPPPELGDWAVEEGHLSREELEKAKEESGFLEEVGDLFTGDDPDVQEQFAEKSMCKRRYTEWVLGADEETYIFGGAHPREGEGSATNVDNLVIREHEGTGQFIVSDKSETELVEDARTTIAFLFAVGLVGIPWGILGLLRQGGFL